MDSAVDFQSARARALRDLEREKEEVRISLASELLPVLDNLDRAIEAGEGEGTQLVRAQLARVLEGYGLERFDAVGERFDPRRHEAMDVAPVADPRKHGTVVAQWQAGYRVGDRVVRPARVQVGRY